MDELVNVVGVMEYIPQLLQYLEEVIEYSPQLFATLFKSCGVFSSIYSKN